MTRGSHKGIVGGAKLRYLVEYTPNRMLIGVGVGVVSEWRDLLRAHMRRAYTAHETTLMFVSCLSLVRYAALLRNT